MVRDYQGREVLGEESPSKIIKIWVITYGPERDFFWVRGYQDALETAKNILEERIDRLDEDELGEGFSIKMHVREVSLEHYLESIASED